MLALLSIGCGDRLYPVTYPDPPEETWDGGEPPIVRIDAGHPFEAGVPDTGGAVDAGHAPDAEPEPDAEPKWDSGFEPDAEPAPDASYRCGPLGTACDDGDLCTDNDVCQSDDSCRGSLFTVQVYHHVSTESDVASRRHYYSTSAIPPSGFTAAGVSFRLPPPYATGLRPLLRLHSSQANDFIVSYDPNEASGLGYSMDGTIGEVASAREPGTVRFLRLVQPSPLRHLVELEGTPPSAGFTAEQEPVGHVCPATL